MLFWNTSINYVKMSLQTNVIYLLDNLNLFVIEKLVTFLGRTGCLRSETDARHFYYATTKM